MRRRWVIGICLLLACVGLSWFVYQILYVPQQTKSAPDWHASRWIQAADRSSPVAYFRYTTSLNTLPDAAFVTIAANQIFRLYINGTLVGSNAEAFTETSVLRASIFDVQNLLAPGANVLSVRVANADSGPPSVRVSFGLVYGTTLTTRDSGASWLATAQSNLVYPRFSARTTAWTTVGFLPISWSSAQEAYFAGNPLLAVDSRLYERPVATHWLSAGGGEETYLVGTFSLPPSITTTWLRLAAVGTAQVYLNGSLLLTWQGQAPVPRKMISDYLSDVEQEPQYRGGLASALYPIPSLLLQGENTLAIHVTAPGITSAHTGLETLNAALSLDLLLLDSQGHHFWLQPDASWHAATRPVEKWLNTMASVQNWPAPIERNRPGTTDAFYLPTEATARNVPLWSFSALFQILSCCSVLVSVLWLLGSYSLGKYTRISYRAAFSIAACAFLPTLICEFALLVLTREPLFPSPYNLAWGLCLLFILMLSYLVLFLTCAPLSQGFPWYVQFWAALPRILKLALHPLRRSVTFIEGRWGGSMGLKLLLGQFLRNCWPWLLIMLVALPLVYYDLAYEPYWQDELSSYYATQGVLSHGLPFFLSGFLYEKAELYTYLLALWQFLLGFEQLRLISALLYLCSIPLLYYAGLYLFGRRCAMLATVLLAFSPSALLWSRQVRMYELAQVLTLCTLIGCCRAWERRQYVRLTYFALACLVAMYLSHEETFITLPGFAVALCVYSHEGKWRLPAIVRQRHWWYAALLAGSIIAIQLWLTRVTHPPVLGTDSSQRPMVQLSLDNLFYYVKLLLFPWLLKNPGSPFLTCSTMLALLGSYLACRGKHGRARFCAVFWLCSMLTLIFAFTMQAERYLYPLLPMYYLLAAYALLRISAFFWDELRFQLAIRSLAAPCSGAYALLWGTRFTVSLAYLSVLFLPIFPLSSYNLFISRVSGLTYHHRFPDYSVAGAFIRQHWRKGDVLLSVAPDLCTFYYVGHTDYFFSIDRALFLFERNGRAIDTSIGALALFNQEDLLAVLAAHERVWILSDNAVYQAQAIKRFHFPPDMQLVYEGYGSAVYLRGG